MIILYVSSSGTDDYTVDGNADNVQINAALYYAYTHGTASAPVTVYLRGPFTYDLASWLLIGSNTILTGDSTAHVRLKTNAGWGNIYSSGNPGTRPLIDQLVNPIKNVEVHGFEIDCNAGDMIGAGLRYSENQSGYMRGKLNYIVMFFKYGTNIKMHDMYLHDGLSDGMRMDQGNGLYFYNNVVKRMGHDGSFFIRSKNFEVYGNDTLIRTNSAHRLWNAGYGSIHDNTLQPYELNGISGGPGIQIEDSTGATKEVEVYNNECINCWGQAMWVIEYGPGYTVKKNLYVHDNIITGCGRINSTVYNGGISLNGWDGARFENNTITGCYNAGFLINDKMENTGHHTIYLTNNKISGTLRTLATGSNVKAWTGYGVVNGQSDKADIVASGNSVSNNAEGNYYNVDPSITNKVNVAAKLGVSAAVDMSVDTKRNISIAAVLNVGSDAGYDESLRDAFEINTSLSISSAIMYVGTGVNQIEIDAGIVLSSDIQYSTGIVPKIYKNVNLILSGTVTISDQSSESNGGLKAGDTVLLFPYGGDYTLLRLADEK